MSTNRLWDASGHPHRDFIMWAQCIEEPLALVDEDGTIVAFNEALETLLGIEDEEPDLFDLILTEDGQKLLAHWDGSIIDRHQPTKFLARHASSSPASPSRTMLWKIRPSPKPGFWLLEVRDVELEQSRILMPIVTQSPDLSSLASKACIANILQVREFLSSLPRVIHDLKAPNRRVRMFAQLLLREIDEHVNEEVRNYTDSIVENASRNEALVEEIKRYFSLHKLLQKPSTISIGTLLEDAAYQVNVPFEQLSISGPTHLEVKVPQKLALTAISALIENAALHGKHAPDQEASIAITIARTNPELGGESPWTLRLSDQGSGFREGLDGLLFEPLRTGLSRASGGQSSGTTRFGMGLATAHRCMLFLGGELELLDDAPGAHLLLSFPPCP